MKDLTELNAYITNIPTIFGVNFDSIEEEGVKTFPEFPGEDDVTNYQTGFPEKYGLPPTESVRYILRSDFNKVGALATQELFFKKAGGSHTFSSKVSGSYGGYQKDIVLEYYDGTYLKKVKSECSENQLDFTSSTIKPYGIDCIPTDGTSIVWSTVNNVYGIDEDIMHIGADFSRGSILQEGLALSQDSLIVIGCVDYERLDSSYTNYDGIKCTVTLSGTDTGTIDTLNKGKTGIRVFSITLLGYTLNYPYPLNGTANYANAFFARKGTSISVSMKIHDNADVPKSNIAIYTYPIKKTIGD